MALVAMTMVTVSSYADYQSTVLNDHPIGYWPLSLYDANATNGVATDLSGNGNNGAYENIYPGYNNASGPTAFLTNGVSFDGETTTVGIGTPTAFPSMLNFGGTITMEGWVQPVNPSQSFGPIIAEGYDPAYDNAENYLWVNANQYQGGTYTSSISIRGAYGGTTTTNWAYVVTTFDGTNWNTYVNAHLVAQGADTVGALNFPDPWAIGAGTISGSSSILDGNLTQVALYTNALSPAQVLNHYFEAELNSSPASSPPIITTEPQSVGSYVGGSVTISVIVASGLPTTNQWFKSNSPLLGQTNAVLTLTNLQLSSAGNYSVTVGNANGSTNSTIAVLSITTPVNLTWNGANGSTWDTATTANWINQANQQQTVFHPGDTVLFDDTPGVPVSININGLVMPSTMVVNSSTNNFTFNPYSPGSDTVSGPVNLIKEGTSTLALATAGQFKGPVTIEGGLLLAEGYSFQATPSITITNNSTMDFYGSSYVDTNQTMYISGTGLNGEGAIYNSLYNPNSTFNVELTGDATIGCQSGNVWGFNTGSGAVISGQHKLTVNWGGASDYTEWNGIVFATNSGDFELAHGKLGIKNMGQNFGPATNTFTVDAGAELDFWTSDFGYSKNYHVFGLYQILAGFTDFNGNFVLENGSQFTGLYGSGSQNLDGTFTLNGITHFVLGDANFVFTNVISGPGGFVWDAYNHAMVLEASNTYTGPTVIGGGQQVLTLSGNGSISDSSLIFLGGGQNNNTNIAIDVSQRQDQTLTLVSGQTLAGIGGINGNLVVSAGATISPAGTNIVLGMTEGSNSVGIIADNDNITLHGTTIIKLDGLGTNDQIEAGANLTYGGTLNLANMTGSPLAAGDSFQIFNAAAYIGSFAHITPATPGSGLAWDTTHLNSGQINVIVSSGAPGPIFSSTTIADSNLILSGTGGTTNSTYYVLTTTNLLTSWIPIATNSYDANGDFNFTNAIIPGAPQRFYRIQQP